MGRHERSVAASQSAFTHNLSAAAAAGYIALCVALSLPAVTAAISNAKMGAPPPTAMPPPPPAADAVTTPVWFEPNVGQDASGASFIARLGGAGSMELSPTHAAITVGSGSTQPHLGLDLIGASDKATIAGADEQPGIANYFTGSRSQWHTHVPMYGQVVTSNAYSGINLVWHSGGSSAEYDFDVAPGANPGAIAWHVSGFTSLRVDRSGALSIGTATGSITENAPHAYQTIGGVQQPVPSRFAVRGDSVRFDVGRYDRSRPLVIDPALAFSTYVPSAGMTVRVDGQGNIYVQTASLASLGTAGVIKYTPGGGVLYSTAVTGSVQPVSYTPHDLAVDSTGNAFITGDTSAGDYPTTSGSFETSCPKDQSSASLCGGTTAVLSELDPSGNLAYSTYLGKGLGNANNSSGILGTGVALGPLGTLYLTGIDTTGTPNNIPTTTGAFQAVGDGANFIEGDTYISKFDLSLPGDGTGIISTTNKQLVYSTYLGEEFPGNGYDDSAWPDIAVDSGGNAYVTGSTSSSTFPATTGAFQGPPTSGFTGSTGTNPQGGFVREVSPSGRGSADLIYSTYLFGITPNPSQSSLGTVSGAAVNEALGLALGPGVSAGGRPTIDVVGGTGASDFPVTANALQQHASTCNGGDYECDGFFLRINPVGAGSSDLLYSTYIGGSLNEAIRDVTSDAAGHAFITGYTVSPDFPVTSTALQLQKCCTTSPFGDAFVAEFDPTASGVASLLFSTYLGGSGWDYGNGVALDAGGRLLVTGNTSSPSATRRVRRVDFPVTTSKRRTVIGTGFLSIISGL